MLVHDLGNAACERASLHTPVNGATDMAATLQQLGFAITLRLDADLQTMQAALQMFSQRLRQGGVGHILAALFAANRAAPPRFPSKERVIRGALGRKPREGQPGRRPGLYSTCRAAAGVISTGLEGHQS
jgi:hypothetical protein